MYRLHSTTAPDATVTESLQPHLSSVDARLVPTVSLLPTLYDAPRAENSPEVGNKSVRDSTQNSSSTQKGYQLHAHTLALEF